MSSEERREGADGNPARKQFSGRVTNEAAHIISRKWYPGQAHAVDQPDAQHHVFIIGYVVTCPYGGVPLDSCKTRAREVNLSAVFHQGLCSFVGAAGHLETIDVPSPTEGGTFSFKIHLNVLGEHVSPCGDLIH